MKARIVLLLVATSAAIPPAPAQDGAAPLRQFRESMALQTSAVVVKRLATVGEYLADGQIDEAIAILRDIAAASGDTLVPVEPGRYVNARRYGHMLIAGLSPEGLGAYRQRVDAQARQWFEQGRDRRDEELVRRVVEQAFASSFGDDALWLLGEWAWDRGELSAARAYWTQMLPIEDAAKPGQPLPVLRYPDSSHSPAEILARLVLVSIVSGDLERAADELAILRTRHAAAEGELAGRSGKFVEILEAVLTEARTWTPPAGAEPYQTFAANPQRNAALPGQGLDVGHVLWSDTLPPERWTTDNPRPALKPDPPLRLFPVVHGDMVLASDGQQIYHWKLRANEPTPVWPVGERGTVLYPDVPEALRTGYISSRVIGVARHTLTVHNNRLYAKLGSPIAGRTVDPHTYSSDIVCLDLLPEKQGKRVWELPAEELMPGEPGWMFEGTPAVQGDRVYVALRRNHPDAILRVACLEADSGRPIWNRQVGSSHVDVGDKSHLMSHLLLTLGENAVFYSTDMGAIFALDHRDGQPLWAVTYESQPPDDVESINDPLRNGLTPCLYYRGLIVAAPNDYHGVLAIDAETGLVRWEQRRLPDRIRHLLGVGHGKVFVSGKSLWGLDLRTGSFRPPDGWGEAPEQNPGLWGYGQGLLLGDLVLFPKRDAIDVREQSTGRRARLVRLREHERSGTGGNLVVAGRHLIIAEPNRIVVFSDTSGLLEEQRRIVEANPQSPQALVEFGQTLVLAGQFEEALKQFRRAAELPASNQPEADAQDEARLEVFELLVRLGAQAGEKGDLPQAVSRLMTAIEQSPDDRSKLAAAWRLAEIQEGHGRPEHAVRTYQSILREEELARLPAPTQDQRPAGESAHAAINRLIQEHGNHVYAAFEVEAARQFTDALATGEPQSVQRALELFPNARSAAGTRLELARLLRQRHELRDAARTCREVVKTGADPGARQGALELLARIHEDRGYWRLAARTWRQWADEFPEAAVAPEADAAGNGDAALDAAEFVARRLSSAQFAGELRHPGDGPPLPWERVWTRPLPTSAEVLIPAGAAPAAALDLLLFNSTGLHAVDRTTGRERWTARSENPAIWAACLAGQLVVGTRRSLRARSFETGEILWERSWISAEGRGVTPDPSTGATPQFAATSDVVIARLPDSRLIAVDIDGVSRWEFSAPGRLGPRWLCDESHVVLQSFSPERTLILDTATAQVLVELPGDAEHWRRDPVRLTPDRFVLVDSARRIRTLRADSGDVGWTYAGPTSHANSDPDVMAVGGRLLAIIDGDTLISIDPETGERRWSQALSRTTTTCAMLAADQDSVYTAADGILRRIALSDGSLVWERFVGPADGCWRAQRFDRYVAASPVQAAGPRIDSSVLICDAESGEPVQELRLPPDPDPADSLNHLDLSAPVALIHSGSSLVGFRLMKAAVR